MFHQCSSMNHCLRDLRRDENYDLAVGGFSQHLSHLPQFSAAELFCFDKSERVISYPITLIVKNEQKTIIDTIIRRLLEFGIIQKLKKDIQSKKIPNRIVDDEPSKLQLGDICGILLFAYGIGISFSILIWLLELFVNWKLHNRKAHRSWKIIERCIDGHRHYFRNLPERFRNKY